MLLCLSVWVGTPLAKSGCRFVHGANGRRRAGFPALEAGCCRFRSSVPAGWATSPTVSVGLPDRVSLAAFGSVGWEPAVQLCRTARPLGVRIKADKRGPDGFGRMRTAPFRSNAMASRAAPSRSGSGCSKSRLSREQPRSAIPVAGCGRSAGHWIKVCTLPPSTSEPSSGIVMSHWSMPREIGSAGPEAMGQAAIAYWMSSTAATHPMRRDRSASRERVAPLSRPNQRGRAGGSAEGSTAITSRNVVALRRSRWLWVAMRGWAPPIRGERHQAVVLPSSRLSQGTGQRQRRQSAGMPLPTGQTAAA